MKECFIEQKFCHPRWQTDFLSLERNIEAAYTISHSLFDDGWNIVEIVCLTMATIQSIMTIIYIGLCGNACILAKEDTWTSSENLRNARNYWSAVFILVTWVRLNVCLRHHTKFGPFISMLAGCGGKFIQIAFLFFEFFVPFCVAGWVLFSNDTGGNYQLTEVSYIKIINTFTGSKLTSAFLTPILIHAFQNKINRHAEAAK